MKIDINRKTHIELKGEIDQIHMQIHRNNATIDQILRQINNLKRTCENRQNQITLHLKNSKDLMTKNERLNQDNKNLSNQIRFLKEERNKLDHQSEKSLQSLEDNLNYLKTLQKQGRNLENANNRLLSALEIAEKDNGHLLDQIKNRQDIVDLTFRKLDNLTLQISTLTQNTEKLRRDCLQSQKDYLVTSEQLEFISKNNKQQTKKIKIVQSQLRLIENQLDKAVIERDNLEIDHQAFSSQNKILNDEIDKILLQIMETERLNSQMQNQLKKYIQIDEEAREMLNRRKIMVATIDQVNDKLSLTSQMITHLR